MFADASAADTVITGSGEVADGAVWSIRVRAGTRGRVTGPGHMALIQWRAHHRGAATHAAGADIVDCAGIAVIAWSVIWRKCIRRTIWSGSSAVLGDITIASRRSAHSRRRLEDIGWTRLGSPVTDLCDVANASHRSAYRSRGCRNKPARSDTAHHIADTHLAWIAAHRTIGSSVAAAVRTGLTGETASTIWTADLTSGCTDGFSWTAAGIGITRFSRAAVDVGASDRCVLANPPGIGRRRVIDAGIRRADVAITASDTAGIAVGQRAKFRADAGAAEPVCNVVAREAQPITNVGVAVADEARTHRLFALIGAGWAGGW